jgi:pimeloyl-ACP methyl ester carboxylesterase
MPQFKRDNATIHYELEGDGPPVVAITGFSDHSNSPFNLGIRMLLRQRYRLLSPDNRGSGQTAVHDGAPATIHDMADDVVALMDEAGLPRAHIMGISMGGCIALSLAIRHPDRVASLVAAVSLPSPSTPRGVFMLQTVRDMWEQGLPYELINRYSATFLLGADVFEYDRFMRAWVNAPEDPLRQKPDGFALQRDAMLQFDVRDRLAEIRAPTLIVSSPEDLLVPPHLQDELADGIPGAVIKRYPGGHVFMGLPMYRDAFFADVFDFWEQHAL